VESLIPISPSFSSDPESAEPRDSREQTSESGETGSGSRRDFLRGSAKVAVTLSALGIGEKIARTLEEDDCSKDDVSQIQDRLEQRSPRYMPEMQLDEVPKALEQSSVTDPFPAEVNGCGTLLEPGQQTGDDFCEFPEIQRAGYVEVDGEEVPVVAEKDVVSDLQEETGHNVCLSGYAVPVDEQGIPYGGDVADETVVVVTDYSLGDMR
ncbi:MAG: hypothetical protein ABEJ03_02065, partial [Candidatus Nanohaloarchaea archaeon]